MNDINLQLTQAKLSKENDDLRAELNQSKQEIKQYLNELAQSEERYSLAMRGANDGLWDWNIQTAEVYYSPRWKSMFGYTEKELLDNVNTWEQLVHKGDLDRVFQSIKDYLTGKTETYEVEMRMLHKNGHYIDVLSRAFRVIRQEDNTPIRLVGTYVDITEQKKAQAFDEKHTQILEMIAAGYLAKTIYDAIALLYESRHSDLYSSMLELDGNTLLHGGAPSLPKAYSETVHGLKNGPNVGSCGTSTYTGKRVLVENINTDPKWADLKHVALPFGLQSCWSQPIKSSSGKILGAFGMYKKKPALPNESELNDLISAARLAGMVMERDHDQKRICELAYTDNLTRLANRAHLYEHTEQYIKGCQKSNDSFAVLYLDLDNFKDVNDSLGHDAGDVMLKVIAKRLKSICRDMDFIARLGGDEFCILVNEAQGEYAEEIAKLCLEKISQPIELAARKLMPTCSIGIARYPKDGQDISTLITVSDTSLYSAKEKGKNQYTFYQSTFTEDAEYRFQIEQYLRNAIEGNELSLVYQPQVCVTTGKIMGVEALSRWNHPLLGQISPDEFIPITERIGMIKPLTEWVLNTACQQAIDWVNLGYEPLFMSVNISPNHFLDKNIVSLIANTIEKTGISPSNLKLEVTEGVVQTDPKNLVVFKELKKLGVKLAIDDFGTGYSSFASLKHLNVDYLKIDKYFIDDILTNKHSQILVKSMVDLGHQLNYKIIAEGVETEEQLAILKDFNCDGMQGYLFSKPVTGEMMHTLFELVDM